MQIDAVMGMGYDVGRIDGVLGLKSRSAVRDTISEAISPSLAGDSWATGRLDPNH